ncbi:V-Type Proton Atpase Subunit S1-Like Protein [Manis pentadactyla]|nr:V-Type Proton Atpase Subunit S1-Like Protein [Manis pentadactyla]
MMFHGKGDDIFASYFGSTELLRGNDAVERSLTESDVERFSASQDKGLVWREASYSKKKTQSSFANRPPEVLSAIRLQSEFKPGGCTEASGPGATCPVRVLEGHMCIPGRALLCKHGAGLWDSSPDTVTCNLFSVLETHS